MAHIPTSVVKDQLRFTLVEMLFALAISEVGLEISQYYLNNQHLKFFDYPHVLSHVILATYILISSWIGWQVSISPGNLKAIRTVFDLQFLILLVDVALVLCYFILIKGVESPKEYTPSAHIESLWSVVIFALYLFWDFLTKFFHSRIENGRKIIHFDLFGFFKRGWITILCLALVSGIFAFMEHSATAFEVVLVDMALLAVFILFRGLKTDIHKVVDGIDRGLFYYWRLTIARVLPVILLVLAITFYFVINCYL